jgi:hypothetical protein
VVLLPQDLLSEVLNLFIAALGALFRMVDGVLRPGEKVTATIVHIVH